jgi:hypothetical protein
VREDLKDVGQDRHRADEGRHEQHPKDSPRVSLRWHRASALA